MLAALGTGLPSWPACGVQPPTRLAGTLAALTKAPLFDSRLRLGLHGVGQCANAFNGYGADVAVFHKQWWLAAYAYACGCAGDDDVACF